MRGIFVSHFSKELSSLPSFLPSLALSRDLQIVSRNAKMFVRVGRDYISRRRIEFRDDFGVDSLRGRNYDITWVNEIQSEFQCIVTNTHLDRSIDLFPINDFHYDVINDFRSEDEGQDSPWTWPCTRCLKKREINAPRYWKMRSKENFVRKIQVATWSRMYYENCLIIIIYAFFTLLTLLFSC